MTTLQQFNRFRELPRELQLRIWELYECSQPHRRHYFRSMIVWPGRLYAGVDQYTNRRIVNVATANDPNQTRVPDTAVAPWTKIQLPADDNRDNHWVSRDDFSAGAPFCQIQGPNSMTTPAYLWVNFKNDTFCFAHNSGGIINNVGGRDFLQYLQGVPGLFSLTSGPQSQGMSHWFFRVERLALIKFAPDRKVGHFDRQVLGVHPNLRTVTIVAFLGPFRCSHFDPATQRQPDAASAVERIPLKKFLAIRQGVARSCDCDEPRKRLDELEKLRQELVNLFQDRAIVAPRVDVGIEVEVYWTQRPNIASLVVDPQS
ncbi:hypothetical protein Daus18300_007360 [Diaporthe australafricana]|uniref:Uncharacterized protein n=1 Tax=Diaporthe australafricana TaxID=127596 RepID=A0ABR3WNA3_9PEZI